MSETLRIFIRKNIEKWRKLYETLRAFSRKDVEKLKKLFETFGASSRKDRKKEKKFLRLLEFFLGEKCVIFFSYHEGIFILKVRGYEDYSHNFFQNFLGFF